jgi:hypothetical protein
MGIPALRQYINATMHFVPVGDGSNFVHPQYNLQILFIIYLPWVLCLSVCDCVCVCVTICVGTLCYSFSFINQTDQGDGREGLKKEGLKRDR